MSNHNKLGSKKVVIVVIDSGIDITKSDLELYVKESTGYRINCESYIVEDKEMQHFYEHGTAVAMIIRHLCPQVELISINIFDKSLGTDGRIMLCAMDKAIDYKPDIIHMSIGTTRWVYLFKLKGLVKKAKRNGIIIVSAANNQGMKSYPAYSKHVVGVKGADIHNVNEYFYKDNFFYAPLIIKGIRGIDQLEFSNQTCGTSMSAAYITGHLAKIKAIHNIENNDLLVPYLINQFTKN